MSSPGPDAVKFLHEKGLILVVAAGNDFDAECKDQIPAMYPEVLCIASTAAEDGTSACALREPVLADSASWFTSDGRYKESTGVGVSISAPGERFENFWEGIKRCVLSSEGVLSLGNDGGTFRTRSTL